MGRRGRRLRSARAPHELGGARRGCCLLREEELKGVKPSSLRGTPGVEPTLGDGDRILSAGVT